MRSVLRVEVEAVRFLKEEPHKMDSMLKRVKALTEALSALRRYAYFVRALLQLARRSMRFSRPISSKDNMKTTFKKLHSAALMYGSCLMCVLPYLF